MVSHVLRMPPATLQRAVLPSGGSLMALEREAEQKKHEGGHWRNR